MSTTSYVSDKSVLDDNNLIVSRRRQYSDLDLKLKRHPAHNDITPLRDIEAVKQSIKNLVLTSKGDRLFQPWLGCGVRDLLFEPADNVTQSVIQQEIYEVIQKYEPRVEIQSVDVFDDPDTNSYKIVISFLMINLVQEVNIEFYLERVR